jgi:hypothetical protein
MFDVYIHFFVCAFFSVLSRPLFSSQNFFLVRELECERDTNALKHTHTHTHKRRESEREKSAHATRDSFLFIFLSLYPSADASTKRRGLN